MAIVIIKHEETNIFYKIKIFKNVNFWYFKLDNTIFEKNRAFLSF